MSRTIKYIFLLGLVLSLALSACTSPTPTAAPVTEAVVVTPAPVVTEAPATEAPAAVALKVTGSVVREQAWTEEEVRTMQVMSVEYTNKDGKTATYAGVSIFNLLGMAEPTPEANTVTFVADDGFTSEISLEELLSCGNCIVAFREEGGFSTVMPGFPDKLQVKGVIEIKVGVSEASAPEPPANPNIILATTTSTQDSGLLDVLVPLFEKQTGYKVQTVAVGTGEALKMGEEGNADILLVHAPASEVTFMDGGNGKDRFLVMHNDFIIVGPAADPAGIKGMTSAVDAFKAMAKAAVPFISRGDDSGTNKKELALWKSAGVDPAGQAWYTETGQGMGASLTVASEKEAYILTDRATYLANKDNYQLDLLVEGDNSLLNVYHVITVSPDKWPKVNYEGAMAFAKFMTDPATQKVIGEFGADKFGQPLFFPDADKTDADLGLE